MPLFNQENYCDFGFAGKIIRIPQPRNSRNLPALAVEVEESLHSVQQSVRRSFASFFAKCFERWVQQLVDDAVDAVLDRLSILFAQVLKFGRQPREFILADIVPLFPQPFDDRTCCTVIDIVHEVVSFVVDYLQRDIDFSDASFAVSFARGFQVVDVVQENIVVNVPGVSGEVTRCSEIENERRLASACVASCLETRGIDDRFRGACCADDDVRLAEPFVK